MKEAILTSLALNPTVNGVEIMMQGLNDKNAEFKESVQDELESITDKRFESYIDARDWWEKHREKFEKEWEEDEEE